MRVVGLDFGAARVGVAVSDELGSLAHPRPHVSGKDRKKLLQALRQLAEAEGAERFVVGLPVRMDGGEGLAARGARAFAKDLERVTGLPVELLDERLTTRQAHDLFRQQGVTQQQSRTRIDSASAALILQTWLDGRRQREPQGPQ